MVLHARRKNCNNYAENINHHHSKFSCPGNQMPSFVNACLGTCGNDCGTEDKVPLPHLQTHTSIMIHIHESCSHHGTKNSSVSLAAFLFRFLKYDV